MKNKLIIMIMIAFKLVCTDLCNNPKYKTCDFSDNKNMKSGSTEAYKCQQNSCQSSLASALSTIASQGNTLAANLFGSEGPLVFAQKNINSLHNIIALNLLHTVPFDPKTDSISIISENTPTYASFSPDSLDSDAYRNSSISTSNIMYVLGQAAYANFYNPSNQNKQPATPGYDALAGYNFKPSPEYQPAVLECLNASGNSWTNGTCLSPAKKACLSAGNSWTNKSCVSNLKEKCLKAKSTYTEASTTAESSCSCKDEKQIFDRKKGECVSCGDKLKKLNNITGSYECQTLQEACDDNFDTIYDKNSQKCLCMTEGDVYANGKCSNKTP